MQHSSRLMPTRLSAVLLIVAALSAEVWCQAANLPARTSCKQWDNTYLNFFNAFFWITLGGSAATGLALPLLLGRLMWWATSPRWRIVWITLVFFALGCLIVIALPRLIGFEWLGAGLAYPDCAKVPQFGAEGLLYGAVGSNVAAVALWPYMLLLFSLSALAGGAVAFGLSEAKVIYGGLYARVKGAMQ